MAAEDFVTVGLEFKPCTAVGDDLCAEKAPADLIDGLCIVCAGRTDKLADDDPLRTVDNEGTLIGHEWKFAHEYFLILDHAGFPVDKAYIDPKRRGIVYIALLAFGHAVLGMLPIYLIAGEFENKAFRKIPDGGDIRKRFAKALFNELTI